MDNDTPRKAGDWHIIHSLHIGDKEVVFGENTENPDNERYLCGYCQRNVIVNNYTQCMIGNDYLEIMQLYAARIADQIQAAKRKLEEIAVPLTPITADQCYPNDLSQSIEGKVVAIKAEVFRREYRTAPNQIVYVNGGFGAQADARGRAVYVTTLYSGTESRFDRSDVMGEIKPEHLPAWAQEKVAHMQAADKQAFNPLAKPKTQGIEKPIDRKSVKKRRNTQER